VTLDMCGGKRVCVTGKFPGLRVCFAVLLLLWPLALVVGCGQSSAPIRESPATAPTQRYDLERDEQRGGHTLEKHVGRSDAELQERLNREPNISAASTWTDRETAERTVGEALHANRGRIETWMRRGLPRPNLAVHLDAGRVIGRTLHRGDSHAVDSIRAVIVLRADGPDFYVLTAYPED
jgi:hypothetical protein